MTTADIPTLREQRTAEILRTAAWLEAHAAEHRVQVLECVASSGSVLEGRFPVHYAGTHVDGWRNKGALLGRAIAGYLAATPLDEPQVMQMTGRYCFLDRGFLDLVERMPGHDFYGREIDELWGAALEHRRKQYFTGAFVLGTEHLRAWVASTDWARLEREMVNVERNLWAFVVRRGLTRVHVDAMNMECNVFASGTPERALF